MNYIFWIIAFWIYSLFFMVQTNYNTKLISMFSEWVIGNKSVLTWINLNNINSTNISICNRQAIKKEDAWNVALNLTWWCYSSWNKDELFIPLTPLLWSLYEIKRGCNWCETQYIDKNWLIYIKEIYPRMYLSWSDILSY